jgi:CheY-like chemotaxis protein
MRRDRKDPVYYGATMLMETENPSLLLVDDSEDDAFFFTRTLQRSGAICRIRHVSNGTMALQFLQHALRYSHDDLPDAIFLDLKMPVMNGFEVLEWIRAQPFPSEMQVIILSGSEHQNDKDRAARLGATDYLIKPIKSDDLRRLVPNCWAESKTGVPL